MDRMSTLTALLEGDPTAGGTLGRLTERSPRVLGKFVERPITGFGFSREYNEYSDSHVGNETLLLKGGVVGYALMFYFWFNFNLKLFRRNQYLTRQNPYKDTLLVFIIGFIGLFLIHSSSGYIFNYEIRFNTGMALAIILFFTFADRVFKKSVQIQGPDNQGKN